MSKVKREGESGRTTWLLVFVTVSVFCVVFFAARGRFSTPFSSPAVITLLAPFQRAASWAGDQVRGITTTVWDILTVHQQNQMLRSEVEKQQMLYEAAGISLQKAALTRDSAQRQYQLGMLGRSEYEGKQMEYISYEAAAGLAALNLQQAVCNYQWALRGLMTIE